MAGSESNRWGRSKASKEILILSLPRSVPPGRDLGWDGMGTEGTLGHSLVPTILFSHTPLLPSGKGSLECTQITPPILLHLLEFGFHVPRCPLLQKASVQPGAQVRGVWHFV